MLKLTIPGEELFDEESNQFIAQPGFTVTLEHSLVSLSKWESKFEKPFLGAGERTPEEILGYIEAMILEADFPPGAISKLDTDNLEKINTYLNLKQTATWFSDRPGNPKSTEVITSELIYFWMISYRIPLECESWPLNRLFTLLKVFDVKNTKPQKKTAEQIRNERQRLNDERRLQYNTSG